jgi:hypothetical protein
VLIRSQKTKASTGGEAHPCGQTSDAVYSSNPP